MLLLFTCDRLSFYFSPAMDSNFIEQELDTIVKSCVHTDNLNEWVMKNERFKLKNNALICHLNINSLDAHFDNLLTTINRALNKIDFLALTETKLTKTKLNLASHLEIQDFNSFHKLRNSNRGGGIACFVKNNYAVEQLEIDIDDCECMFLRLKQKYIEVMSLLVVY